MGDVFSNVHYLCVRAKNRCPFCYRFAWGRWSVEQFYRRAIRNVVRHGDTDIFPFPIENHVLHDEPDKAVEILKNLDSDVSRSLAEYPPTNVGALAPVGYTGFRWRPPIDPIWKVVYLSWVLSIAEQIEAARISLQRQRVYSYRYE